MLQDIMIRHYYTIRLEIGGHFPKLIKVSTKYLLIKGFTGLREYTENYFSVNEKDKKQISTYLQGKKNYQQM